MILCSRPGRVRKAGRPLTPCRYAVRGAGCRLCRQFDVQFQPASQIPDLLAYVSNVMTLEVGDIVATGTPAGVGILEPGDEVEVEIVGVSRVRNPVKAGA